MIVLRTHGDMAMVVLRTHGDMAMIVLRHMVIWL